MHSEQPNYTQVFLTFARNSLIRDMTFRWDFIIQAVSSLCWMLMNLGFYLLIFQYTKEISGWSKYQFFLFMATTMIINSLVQTFFMPNAAEFSELIRTGGLDFALLKPIDTQFLISFRRVEWASMSNFVFGLGLLSFSLWQLEVMPTWWQVLLFPVFVFCGVLIFYSLMITLAATSIWLGRNQSLYNFWFYITNFSRYPLEIYRGPYGSWLQWFFTFLIPVLVVVNVPARLLAQEMDRQKWGLTAFAVFAAVMSLLASRWIFQSALGSYRSASS
ncbi:ABC transporter permease [Planctomycetales bacterium 10988]|nr:ABC transporter permease [Planctomycetales bacterium 10988]